MKKRILSIMLTLTMVLSLVSAMGITASANIIEGTEYMGFKFYKAIENGDTAEDIAAKIYGEDWFDMSKMNLTVKILSEGGDEVNAIESVDDTYTICYELKMKDLSDGFSIPQWNGDTTEGMNAVYNTDAINVGGFTIDEECVAREYNADGDYIDKVKATSNVVENDDEDWGDYEEASAHKDTIQIEDGVIYSPLFGALYDTNNHKSYHIGENFTYSDGVLKHDDGRVYSYNDGKVYNCSVWKEYEGDTVIIHNLADDDSLEDTYYVATLLNDYVAFNEISFTVTNMPSEYTVSPLEPTIDDTTSDSGYYADKADAANDSKKGIIAFTSKFANLLSDFSSYPFKAEDKFGIAMFKTSSLGDDDMIDVALKKSTFDDLKAANGFFYSFVTDIPYSEFGTTVYAKPFAIIGGTTYWGNLTSTTVNANKWLGQKSN